jgi:3-oxoadipate enol-lactonase
MKDSVQRNVIMPVLKHDRLSLYFETEGADNAPNLILSNELGTSLNVWAPQIPALSEHFQLLRYDPRGHGRSSIASGHCSIAALGEDVIALMDQAGIQRTHFCGVALGGMVGIWLASHHPQRIERLVVSNTSALAGPAAIWDARIEQVRSGGMEAIADAVIQRWFTRDFQEHAVHQVNLVRKMLVDTSPAGYIAGCMALRDMDLRTSLQAITCPTLVIGGRYDKTTSPAQTRQMAEHIRGARYLELNAAHLMNWEIAQSYTTHLKDFLFH